MDAVRGQGMYPLHRCKTIHLVRHAQGFHNVAGEKDHSAYMSPELFDAALTPLGWQQVDNLRKHVHSTGLSKKIELVVVSPLLRTMQTAVGVFGGAGFDDGINAAPLMTENTGKSNRPAISTLNAPPFVAMELCREHLCDVGYCNSCQFRKIPIFALDLIMAGVHWCDKRRSITEYKPLFPAIDFSLASKRSLPSAHPQIETDEDTLWTLDVREADEDLAERGQKFLNWLWTREESEIAVVTHSGFLIHTLSAFGYDCQPPVKEEICKPFNNCELRSMVFVDRSMAATGSSKTNFPGKIPDGMDAPSEEAVEKN
ncbi:hypothetical protein SASPL_106333 [Salvia splendens]|uniref:Phosphoglycerate mutase n=1 Tax=Salvia splendens TaxID=180675 RepID=A0A8X8YKS7_SALSN|nr:hypothetical protein SASPL_106333 [Salvia splendens]